MAKYFFRLLLLVACIVGLFAILGALLPREYEFASEIEIAAPVDRVFDEFDRLANWKTWSQWDPDRIPSLTVQISGKESGVGSVLSWTDVRGDGKLWVTQSIRPERLEYKLLFANFPAMTSHIELAEKAGKTHVRWSSQGRLPRGPFYGYFAPFFPTQMQWVYDDSLARLKEKLESSHAN